MQMIDLAAFEDPQLKHLLYLDDSNLYKMGTSHLAHTRICIKFSSYYI